MKQHNPCACAWRTSGAGSPGAHQGAGVLCYDRVVQGRIKLAAVVQVGRGAARSDVGPYRNRMDDECRQPDATDHCRQQDEHAQLQHSAATGLSMCGTS